MTANSNIRLALLSGSAVVLWTGAALAQDASQVAFGSGMQSGFPESVTSTSDGTLYSGSMTGGMLHRAAPGSTTAEVWVDKPADGPGNMVGVFADEAAGTLWACYADLAAFSGGEAMPSVLRAYDLASGEETGSYTFPESSFCNDIATTSDGTAYAADTMGARVMRVAPGSDEAEVWFSDPLLAGVDGLSFGPDGALYLNSVTTNKLFRLEMGSDGSPGTLTELTPSEPLQGADGMRFGPDGTLYLAENGAGRVDALTIDGDNVTVTEVAGGFTGPTAVTLVGDTLWVAEAKLGMMGGDQDPGTFYVHPVSLSGGTSDTAAASSGGSSESLVTSLGQLGSIDLSNISSGDIRIVKLSEIEAASAEDQTALDQAVEQNQSTIEDMRQRLSENEFVGATLGELGIALDDVLSVEVSDGGLVIYVDDAV